MADINELEKRRVLIEYCKEREKFNNGFVNLFIPNHKIDHQVL